MLEASILLFYILLQKGISLQPYIIATGHYCLFESYFFLDQIYQIHWCI